jgi:hypothetical protein
MTTTTKTRKPVTRSAKVTRLGDATILWLTVDKNVTAYRVTPLPCAFGKAAFHLQKADKGDGQPEEYDVLLDGQRSTCECKGFLRHGMKAADGRGCKHVAGCQAAVNAGQLQAAPKPQAAVVTNAEEPIARVLLGGELHRQEMTARKVNAVCFECKKPYADCTCTI